MMSYLIVYTTYFSAFTITALQCNSVVAGHQSYPAYPEVTACPTPSILSRRKARVKHKGHCSQRVQRNHKTHNRIKRAHSNRNNEMSMHYSTRRHHLACLQAEAVMEQGL